MATKNTNGQCPTLRHIRREHSSLNLRTGSVSGVEKVTWATDACSTPLFGNDREVGKCRSCQQGWTVPGSRFASDCTLEQAQADYAEATKVPTSDQLTDDVQSRWTTPTTVAAATTTERRSIMTPQLAGILAAITAAQARIAGMQAENALRAQNGHSPAYGDEAFGSEADQLDRLSVEARQAG